MRPAMANHVRTCPLTKIFACGARGCKSLALRWASARWCVRNVPGTRSGGRCSERSVYLARLGRWRVRHNLYPSQAVRGRARLCEALRRCVTRPCEAVRGRARPPRPCEAVRGRARPCEAVRGRMTLCSAVFSCKKFISCNMVSTQHRNLQSVRCESLSRVVLVGQISPPN